MAIIVKQGWSHICNIQYFPIRIIPSTAFSVQLNCACKGNCLSAYLYVYVCLYVYNLFYWFSSIAEAKHFNVRFPYRKCAVNILAFLLRWDFRQKIWVGRKLFHNLVSVVKLIFLCEPIILEETPEYLLNRLKSKGGKTSVRDLNVYFSLQM